MHSDAASQGGGAVVWNLQFGQCVKASGIWFCARHSSRQPRCTHFVVPAQRHGAISGSSGVWSDSRQMRHANSSGTDG